jgi:membrane-associated protease RseP (regulator of RpoE activity)
MSAVTTPADGAPTESIVTRAVGALAWIIGLVALLAWRPWMFVFAIGVLASIMLHELGHYVTARRSGMKVTQFFLGFGPRVWSIHRNGIEYGLRALPLGGFVKIIGMTAMDEVDPADEAVTYRRASFPKRLLVITAGSLTHVVIALITIVGVYAFAGRVQESGRVTIASVASGSPAAAAGLRAGDAVLAIDRTPVPTEDLFRSTLAARRPGSFVMLTVQRGGEVFDRGATLVQSPYAAKGEVRGFLGVGSDSVARMPISVGSAFVHGPRDLVSGLGQAVVGITRVVNPVNVFGHLTGSNTDVASRPTTLVGAAKMSSDYAKYDGWAGILSLIAALNVSIGVFNMFPMLPLDGGHVAIAVYERTRERKGQRHLADISRLMPLVTITVTLLAFMFITGFYLDTFKG